MLASTNLNEKYIARKCKMTHDICFAADKGDDIFGSEIFPLIPSLLMSPRNLGRMRIGVGWGPPGGRGRIDAKREKIPTQNNLAKNLPKNIFV